MKIALIFPPAWVAFAPYPSLPALTAALRSRGLEVGQFDLNCEVFDDLLSGQRLAEYIPLLERQLYSLPSGAKEQARAYQRHLYHASRLLDQIDQAKDDIRHAPTFYNGGNLEAALRAIEEAFDFYTTIRVSNIITLFPFELGFKRVRDPCRLLKENTVLNPYFLQRVDEIIAQHPLIVGFSVHSFSQLYFALLGAQRIKASDPSIHLTIGGTFLLKYRHRLHDFGAVLPGFDTAIIYDGADALLHICDCLVNRTYPYAQPNILEICNGQVRMVTGQNAIKHNKFVEPDLDGLPLNLYLSPHLIISLPISMGCHWRRCSFCSYNLHRYQEADPEQTVETIERLSRRYNTQWFYFSVSELHPNHIDRLCTEIKHHQLSIFWTSLARPTTALTRDLCRKMYESGCRLMAVGIESASPAVLGMMNKGIRPAEASSVLHNLYHAGIATIAYFIHSFPYEGFDDLERTLQFIGDHQNLLFGYVLGRFILTANAPIGMKPRHYGIEIKQSAEHVQLFVLMQPSTQVSWRTTPPSPKILAQQKQERLRLFKLGTRNFYLDPDQFNPLRAPSDIFFNFLYLSAGKIEHGPGRFADRIYFLTTTPRYDPKAMDIQQFTEGQVIEHPIDGDIIRLVSQDSFLHNKFTDRSVPLTYLISTLLSLIDGRRTVKDIINILSESLKQDPELIIDEILWHIGSLYRDRFLELDESQDG